MARSAVLLCLSLALAGVVRSQDPPAAPPAAATTAAADDNSAQVDPSATCPYQVADQIQTCRSTVYADEAQLPGGPCASTDWACICNVQQGLVACYDPCPGTAPATDVDYNNANCNGQNGYTNQAADPASGTDYQGSQLTTTFPAGVPTEASSTALSSAASSTSLTSASSDVTSAASTTSTAASSGATSQTTGSSASVASSSSSAPATSSSASANVFESRAIATSSVSFGTILVGSVGLVAMLTL